MKHAIERAYERYYAELEREDVIAIEQKIISGLAGMVARKSTYVSIWDVEYGCVIYRVVTKHRRVVTFLPRETNTLKVPRGQVTRKAARRRAKRSRR